MTHALVIGVSAYDHLPSVGAGPFGLSQLGSTAIGAYRFAVWLRDHYRNPDAPLATIRLLLSPSAAEISAGAPEGRSADRDRVRAAVLDWQSDNTGNRTGVSVLYAAGHGTMVSHQDSYVLLQDFAKDRLVLDYSLDVGSVYRGLAGPRFPATQFSFVDACQIRPKAFATFSNIGAGVGLPEEWAGPDVRAASVFFSASPGTPAWGRADATGTIFSTALLDCLGGLGVDAVLGADDAFRITGASLLRALEEQVTERARQFGEVQHVTGGGTGRACVLHRFEEPPAFPYEIRLAPDSARPLARADIWDGDRNSRLVEGERFDSNPASWRLPVGLNSLDVIVPPGHDRFRTRSGVALLVQARQGGPKVVSVE